VPDFPALDRRKNRGQGIRVGNVDAEKHATGVVDRFIRDGIATSHVTTSLINDGAYTKKGVAIYKSLKKASVD
jgi:hypothetical protein